MLLKETIKGPLKLSAGGTWWGEGERRGGRWAAELGISTPGTLTPLLPQRYWSILLKPQFQGLKSGFTMYKNGDAVTTGQ